MSRPKPHKAAPDSRIRRATTRASSTSAANPPSSAVGATRHPQLRLEVEVDVPVEVAGLPPPSRGSRGRAGLGAAAASTHRVPLSHFPALQSPSAAHVEYANRRVSSLPELHPERLFSSFVSTQRACSRHTRGRLSCQPPALLQSSSLLQLVGAHQPPLCDVSPTAPSAQLAGGGPTASARASAARPTTTKNHGKNQDKRDLTRLLLSAESLPAPSERRVRHPRRCCARRAQR